MVYFNFMFYVTMRGCGGRSPPRVTFPFVCWERWFFFNEVHSPSLLFFPIQLLRINNIRDVVSQYIFVRLYEPVHDVLQTCCTITTWRFPLPLITRIYISFLHARAHTQYFVRVRIYYHRSLPTHTTRFIFCQKRDQHTPTVQNITSVPVV